jgi:hypothetical protein
MAFHFEIHKDLPQDIVDLKQLESYAQEFLLRTLDFKLQTIYVTVTPRRESRPMKVDGEEQVNEQLTQFGGHIWVPDVPSLTEEQRMVLGRSSIITLYVDPDKKPSILTLVSTLWHELQHARQHAKGDLQLKDGMFYWRGSPWYTVEDIKEDHETYINSPWEEEARVWGHEGDWYATLKIFKRKPFMWLTLIAPACMLWDKLRKKPE